MSDLVPHIWEKALSEKVGLRWIKKAHAGEIDFQN
jgi:hypothetical protein